jgi:hypothetical protein
MDGDNAIQALAERVEAILVARGFPNSLTVPTTVTAGTTMSAPGGLTCNGGQIASYGPSREIILGYAGSGGLAIAQGNVATHPNGVVLWVSGAGLYARMVGGNDVRIA